MLFTFIAAVLLAATAPPPITVQSCAFATAKGGVYAHGVEIAYVNTAKVAATEVTFAIVHGPGPAHYHVADKGYFAPGVTIDHMLMAPQLGFWHGSDPHGCVPIHVRYADGTLWTGPSP